MELKLKRTLWSLMLFFLTISINFGQSKSAPEKFRVDYNYCTIYDPETDTWTEFFESEHTFVFNINERGDIAHLASSGKTIIYKRYSGVKDGYTSNGSHYQYIEALDEDGDLILIQIFDDTSMGLKLIIKSRDKNSIIIQFVKM